MRFFSIALIAALALTGCATAGGGGQDSPFNDLRQFVREDVSQALTMATAATDEGAPYRARCYSTLLKHILEPGPLVLEPDVKGLVSAFELAAEKIADVKGVGLKISSEEVQANCGYLVDEVKRFVLRNGAKFVPVPGFGAVGSVLGR